jgi:hypothetical protein
MPPTAVRTICDLIYWQYAKIISESSGAGKKNYAFVMDRFKKLQAGEIEWAGSIREYIRERDLPNQCIYCKSMNGLCYDHLIARSRNGPDVPDNLVLACKACNSSKGDKGVYEWYKLNRRYDIPRIAEGKYLKLLYKLHDANDSLFITRQELEKLCAPCELGYLCDETRLTVYCLER